MKKIILSAFAAVAIACCFTSCNTGTGCYLVTYKITIPGQSDIEQTGYYYGSNEDINAWVNDQASKLADFGTGTSVSCSYLKVGKSESDCTGK